MERPDQIERPEETPLPQGPAPEPLPPSARRRWPVLALGLLLMAAVSIGAVVYGTGAVLAQPALLPAQSSAPPGSQTTAESLPPAESEPPVELSREESVLQALAQPHAEYDLTFIDEALDEAALGAWLGDNYSQPLWEGLVDTGQCSLLVWGLGDAAKLPLAGGPVQGIGGQDLYGLVGLSLDGQSVELLGDARAPFSLPREWFFARMAQAGGYARVDAVHLDVPYLSQLDYGLNYGCEATSFAMLISYALQRYDEPVSPVDLLPLLAYSTDGTPETGYVGDPYVDGWTTYMAPQLEFITGQIGSAVDLTNEVAPSSPVSQFSGNRSSLARIRAYLAQGVPVVVLLNGYANAGGYTEATAITHCVVLTGYSAEGFTLHDPYNLYTDMEYHDMLYPADTLYRWMQAHDFRALSY